MPHTRPSVQKKKKNTTQHTPTNWHSANACPVRSVHSVQTQYKGRKLSGKSRSQIKEQTHRDEPLRTFENLPKNVFLKGTNYPRGRVGGMTTAVSSSHQDSADQRGLVFYKFQAYVSYTQCTWHLKPTPNDNVSKKKNVYLMFSAVRRCKRLCDAPVVTDASCNLQSCF